ncbi:MAG: hypothetical protein B6244_02440 [Candidatus Cloacimonetes bacterium 4572_55]|nr:MAG: hypothetical protein B6244_02440 [Candidatus Cloacimonetes bacterium 4572_55]
MILDALFLINALLAVGFAVAMITRKNPIYSALCLIATFFPLAFIFLLLWAPFVAMIQIMVYAGAIMVLFVFVIMMINTEKQELEAGKPKWYRRIAGAIAFLFVIVGFYSIVMGINSIAPVDSSIKEEFGSTAALGHLIFDKYLIQFELVSVLILVAVIGAVFLAKKNLD